LRAAARAERRYYNEQKEAREAVPEEFGGYEEAVAFWDTHATTDYPEAFRTVKVVSERRRRYETEEDYRANHSKSAPCRSRPRP
jgi:hypothetical protein